MKSTIKKLLREHLENNILFYGGLPLNSSLVKSDGISLSKSETIARYWASSKVNGNLYKFSLSPNSKILTFQEFPEKILPKEKPHTHADKERIVNYALVKGYDGVDLSNLFNEDEIRIFNLSVIKKIS